LQLAPTRAAAGNGAIAGFAATVTPNAEQSLPYYALHDYMLDWTLLDEKGRLCPAGIFGTTI
jgi:hypothetical protein